MATIPRQDETNVWHEDGLIHIDQEGFDGSTDSIVIHPQYAKALTDAILKAARELHVVE